VFVNVITGMILISAFVAIIPGLPVISLLVAVQVVNGLLLPINLVFIWRLARSGRVMGERHIRGVLDVLMALTVVLLSSLSTVLVVVTVAGL
jgi:Mn2+/Fe2+ NRAMP family transporter